MQPENVFCSLWKHLGEKKKKSSKSKKKNVSKEALPSFHVIFVFGTAGTLQHTIIVRTSHSGQCEAEQHQMLDLWKVLFAPLYLKLNLMKQFVME